MLEQITATSQLAGAVGATVAIIEGAAEGSIVGFAEGTAVGDAEDC